VTLAILAIVALACSWIEPEERFKYPQTVAAEYGAGMLLHIIVVIPLLRLLSEFPGKTSLLEIFRGLASRKAGYPFLFFVLAAMFGTMGFSILDLDMSRGVALFELVQSLLWVYLSLSLGALTARLNRLRSEGAGS
jgi:hypothetical protein